MEIAAIIISFFLDLITGALEGSKFCIAVLLLIAAAWMVSVIA